MTNLYKVKASRKPLKAQVTFFGDSQYVSRNVLASGIAIAVTKFLEEFSDQDKYEYRITLVKLTIEDIKL